MGHDSDDPGNIGHGPAKHRDQVPDVSVVIGAAAHEHGTSARHVEEIADTGTIQCGFLRGPGFGFPMRSENVLDGFAHVNELLRVIAGRWQDNAEDQVSIPAGQVFGFRQQLRDGADGKRRESEDNHHAPTDTAAHPVHELADPVGNVPLPAGRPGLLTSRIFGVFRMGDGTPPAGFTVRRQQASGQTWNHGNGNQEAQPDAGADGNGNVPKELSGLFLDEYDGHENGDGRSVLASTAPQTSVVPS